MNQIIWGSRQTKSEVTHVCNGVGVMVNLITLGQGIYIREWYKQTV